MKMNKIRGISDFRAAKVEKNSLIILILISALEDAELPDWAAPSDDEAEAEAENDDEKIFNNSHDEFLQQSQMSAKRRLMLHQQEV